MTDSEIIDWEEACARRLLAAPSYEERCRVYLDVYDEDNAFWLQRHGRTGISGTCARNQALVRYVCAGTGPVLDVGGGLGIAGDALPSDQLYVVCDASSLVGRQADSPRNCRFHVTGYATDLPFGRGRFETVLVLDVLEHLHEADVQRCLDECRRVLNSGGTLLVATPHRLSGPWDARRNVRGQHQRAGLHLNEMTVSALLRYLRDHGFVPRGFLMQEYEDRLWRVRPLALWAGLLETFVRIVPFRFRPRLCKLAIVVAVAR